MAALEIAGRRTEVFFNAHSVRRDRIDSLLHALYANALVQILYYEPWELLAVP